ncbi:TerC family protein [Halalkalibacterium ligniniphilum]|uniref:TerC family protein n=1 Tax=Halalkalibacterium ligniniphilum TaxID=1134413 RepID=UPI0004767C14|nr:TerC family protein [Halalkalibacterium ligniniphilum]
MEWDFLLSLFTIIGVDIILGGDNAIVVALACRHLPAHQRNKAMIIGIGLALIIRIGLTLITVKLLAIPFLLGIAGALLIYIAYHLLIEQEKNQTITSPTNLWTAIKTIVIADFVMGFDNVIAVAGAAHGNIILVIIGLFVSVSIIIWGSKLILKLFDHYPLVIYIGAGILAFTAARMITHELMFAPLFSQQPMLAFFFQILVITFVLLSGWITKSFRSSRE